jgi:hypothetical protein
LPSCSFFENLLNTKDLTRSSEYGASVLNPGAGTTAGKPAPTRVRMSDHRLGGSAAGMVLVRVGLKTDQEAGYGTKDG